MFLVLNFDIWQVYILKGFYKWTSIKSTCKLKIGFLYKWKSMMVQWISENSTKVWHTIDFTSLRYISISIYIYIYIYIYMFCLRVRL